MNQNIIRDCREFIQNRVTQRQELALGLKLSMVRENRVSEIGRRLGELKPFIEYFYPLINQRFDSGSEFYERASISRQVYSHMQQDDYDPSIVTVYKIILTLRMNLMDATVLLENAGYTFTYKTTQQLIVIFCIINQITNPHDVDELMVIFDAPVLFAA